MTPWSRYRRHRYRSGGQDQAAPRRLDTDLRHDEHSAGLRDLDIKHGGIGPGHRARLPGHLVPARRSLTQPRARRPGRPHQQDHHPHEIHRINLEKLADLAVEKGVATSTSHAAAPGDSTSSPGSGAWTPAWPRHQGRMWRRSWCGAARTTNLGPRVEDQHPGPPRESATRGSSVPSQKPSDRVWAKTRCDIAGCD